jgi:hypothetical protein
MKSEREMNNVFCFKDSNKSNPKPNKAGSGAVAEVLDLTHDQHSPFKLEFDDHEWKNHINSLKPLGKYNLFLLIITIYFPLFSAKI